MDLGVIDHATLYDILLPPSLPSSLPQEGIWGGTDNEGGVRTLITEGVQPGYVMCRPQGRLPGCLFEFDKPDIQCRSERKGENLIMMMGMGVCIHDSASPVSWCPIMFAAAQIFL